MYFHHHARLVAFVLIILIPSKSKETETLFQIKIKTNENRRMEMICFVKGSFTHEILLMVKLQSMDNM